MKSVHDSGHRFSSKANEPAKVVDVKQQVLRLLETFNQQEVHAAVKDAIHLGSLSFDAVKHLVLCRLEGRPPRLDLELYPYLPRVRVSTTSAGDYMTLLSGRAA